MWTPIYFWSAFKPDKEKSWALFFWNSCHAISLAVIAKTSNYVWLWSASHLPQIWNCMQIFEEFQSYNFQMIYMTPTKFTSILFHFTFRHVFTTDLIFPSVIFFFKFISMDNFPFDFFWTSFVWLEEKYNPDIFSRL